MEDFKDEICTFTECHFSFIDRIRILLHGLASIQVATKTENLPGKVLSESTVSVPRLFHFRKSGGEFEQQNLTSHQSTAADVCAGKDGGWFTLSNICNNCGRVKPPPG